MPELAPPITDLAPLAGGGHLFFGEWPGEGPALVAVHGLTNQHRNLAAVAASLAGELRVVAPDLRGRGASSPAGEESTIEAHAADVLALMDAVGIERAILAGHSMGAYVATAIAAGNPDRVSGVVLIDGGVMLGSEVEALLEQVKPALARLSTVYDSPAAYLEEWRGRGAFDGHWGPVVEQNLLYDLGRGRDGYVPKAEPAAALADLADIAENDRGSGRLRGVRCPALVLAAEAGLAPGSPPVLGEAELETMRAELAAMELRRIPDTGHYTVAISEAGAAACAEAIRSFAHGVAP
ncbi:MAG TPA: alpha/beta fold hydrolase [Solirubrobacterales bacterium]|jgi:pimeloyl-ACP methyl ester carboxylesterase